MHQEYTTKKPDINENVFIIIDKWMKKYHTSPTSTTIGSKGNPSLTIELDKESTTELERDRLISSLKKWASKNKMIVIASSLTIVILHATTIALNSPIFSSRDENNDNYFLLFNESKGEQKELELPSGLYYIDENNQLTNSDKNTNTYFIKIEINEQGKPTFYIGDNILENTLMKNEVEYMLNKYLYEIKEQNIRLEGIEKEEERLSEEKRYIEFYCAIYGLNYESVYQALSDITNNFTDESYLTNYDIGESILKGKYIKCENKEMAILIAVRNIYYAPERYGCPKENLNTGIEFKTEVDYSHQIGYLSNVLGINPALNWAICNAESSFSSDLFLYGHNPSGLNFGNGFEHFPSITAGFIEQSLELLKHKRAGRTTIESIGAVHAPVYEDSDGNLVNSHWIPNVTGGYSTATKNYDSFFGNEEMESFFKEKTEEEKFIELYSSIYGLDKDRVYEIISKMTDDFSSDLYTKYNIIDNALGEEQISSKEEAFVLTIRNIYMNKEKYGIEDDNEIQLCKNVLSYEKQIEYISKLLGVDPSLNYALCLASSGLNSPMFKIMNNPTSIKINGEYASFPTITAGFIEQTLELKKMQESGNFTINAIGLRSPFSQYSNIKDWNLYVYEIYNYVSSNYEEIFEPRKSSGLVSQKAYEYSLQ